MNGKWGVPVAAAILAALVSTAEAREDRSIAGRPARSEGRLEAPLPDGIDSLGLYTAAAVDTYCTVWYTFETNSWQGWTRVDNTAQKGTFFHVDDFAGLGGGVHGGLMPLEGTKSMWCGVRPNTADPYLCSWAYAPGYGNDWSQYLVCDWFAFTGPITFNYRLVYDTEPGNDFVDVEYDAGGNEWRPIASYTSDGDTAVEASLLLTQARTKLRFHMYSDDAWSDQDGLWNTDGACIVDQIRIRDAASLDRYEDWEGEAVGAKISTDGFWEGTVEEAYGLYSLLKNNLTDKDPCGDNYATQIVFFTTNWVDPWLIYTPYCNGAWGMKDPCQDEMVVSPIINLQKYTTYRSNVQNGTIPPEDLPYMGRTLFTFCVYENLPFENLVFYRWYVRTVSGTCPGAWKSDGGYYWSPDLVYRERMFDLTRFIEGDSIQVAFGLVDMCSHWYPDFGDCADHTPGPQFDNARIHRAKTVGPQWTYRDYDLFQDNFPDDEFNIESFVRADAAIDVGANGSIRPGDSIAVDCFSVTGGGIALDPAGGPAVYLHVKCSYIGAAPTKPALAGAQLQGSVGAYKSDDGMWTVIQCDTARIGAEAAAGRYAVDLNDELFTRGYLIEYYFTARDVTGAETALPRWARSYGPYFEFTCLPTLNSNVLYVDDYHAIGCFQGTAEAYWAPTFWQLAWPNSVPDRYDVMSPEEGVSNGPGSRAKNKQLTDNYRQIVWDCGDLNTFTISDGTGADKSNDCQMLIDWMELSEHSCGLWVCGDNVAEELDAFQSSSAVALLGTWCGVDLAQPSYFSLTGGVTGGGKASPLLTGDADAGVFVHAGIPDKLYVFGGCPAVNGFDVLQKTANGKYALRYPAYNSTNYYAAIAATNVNSGNYGVYTMWFGFSLQYVRDDMKAAPIDRFEIARDVFAWSQNGINPGCYYTDTETPKAYRLAQNFPNPFNPVTTIRYDVREKGLVSIKVFDVSGRLVRTLVDEVREPGSHAAIWNGWNNEGRQAASGIYFCRMEAGDFRAVRKLVLLR